MEKRAYESPKAELVEFDKNDVITTSGWGIGEVANSDEGWTDLY